MDMALVGVTLIGCGAGWVWQCHYIILIELRVHQ